MRNWKLIALFTMLSISIFSQNNLLFNQANTAYNKGDYTTAIKLYEKIVKTNNISANLYFNLANSYYKLQKIAPSIYNYEKALQLSPNDNAIQTNYNFAKQTRLDAIDSLPKGFLTHFYEKIVSYNADFWAWISVISSMLFVICFLFFYRSRSPKQRQLFFAGWSSFLLIAIASIFTSFTAEAYVKNNIFAIIYSPEIKIKSEPNLRSESIFTLHEGTKVQVLELVDNWKKIKLADGKIGWIPRKEIKEL